MSSREKEWFTIDELSQAADLKVSTIRMYQHRGLLPGPEMKGRVGYYGQTHLERLRLIARLQGEGYSLSGIARLVQAWDTGRGLTDLLASDEPVTVSRAEFEALFPAIAGNEGILPRLEALGALKQEDEQLVLADDRLLRIGSAFADTGIDLTAVMNDAEHVAQVTDELAERFVELYREYIWEPYLQSGMPADELPTIIDRLNQLQPLAVEAVAASMRNSLQRAAAGAMVEAVEDAALTVLHSRSSNEDVIAR